MASEQPPEQQDFQGEVDTDDSLPSAETLHKVASYKVLDRDGQAHDFQSLWSGPNVPRRVLVIFVRHFFCGVCQEFLRCLAESITPDSLQSLPRSTSLVIIGCGDPALIEMYQRETGCPFPIYTDPTRALFTDLGMVRTLAMGDHPDYLRQSMARIVFDSIVQGLKFVPSGLALKSGDSKQVGGEFLFEPVGQEEDLADGKKQEEEEEEEKHVTWCHRMKTTRDHTEIAGIRKILGMAA